MLVFGWVVSFVVWLGAGDCGRGFWRDLPCCCRPLDFLYIHASLTLICNKVGAPPPPRIPTSSQHTKRTLITTSSECLEDNWRRVLISSPAYLFAQLENGQTNRDNEGEEAQSQGVEGLDLQNANCHGDDRDGLQQDEHQNGHGQLAETMLLACNFSRCYVLIKALVGSWKRGMQKVNPPFLKMLPFLPLASTLVASSSTSSPFSWRFRLSWLLARLRAETVTLASAKGKFMLTSCPRI